VNTKQDLIELLNKIILYFEVQAQYGGVEKAIINHYKKVLHMCNELNFKDIGSHNWSRAYLEANSDWDNPIIETMYKADKLVEYFQKIN
jgi:hypothetical protein